MDKFELYFTKEDYDQFQGWLNLNMEGVTWQGRFTTQFDEFWDNFFIEGISAAQLIERFEYALFELKTGPLSAWFSWLKEKFICFIFINKDISLVELSTLCDMSVSHLASTLRSFFIDSFPHMDEKFTEIFQIGNVASQNLHLDFKAIREMTQISENVLGGHEDEIMPSLEVTLYDEWEYFLKNMKKNLYHPGMNLEKLKFKGTVKDQLKFIKEIAILGLVTFLIIISVKYVNVWYENYLVDKISIYEPQLKWLDKSLTFRPFKETPEIDLKLSFEEIEEVEKSKFLDDLDTEDFDTESEVMLTSWGSVPKNIGQADAEQSDYEELRNRGYRDSRYGRTIVYRLLMQSVDVIDSQGKLNKLLKNYDVTQVDNVKPGKEVPGGIYYNLFVPRENLDRFVADALKVDTGKVYISKTRARKNPPGKNRVFIFVKSI